MCVCAVCVIVMYEGGHRRVGIGTEDIEEGIWIRAKVY